MFQDISLAITSLNIRNLIRRHLTECKTSYATAFQISQFCGSHDVVAVFSTQ